MKELERKINIIYIVSLFCMVFFMIDAFCFLVALIYNIKI